MKNKKFTQNQRITQLEKVVTNLYLMIQAIIDKLPTDEQNRGTSNTENKK